MMNEPMEEDVQPADPQVVAPNEQHDVAPVAENEGDAAVHVQQQQNVADVVIPNVDVLMEIPMEEYNPIDFNGDNTERALNVYTPPVHQVYEQIFATLARLAASSSTAHCDNNVAEQSG